MINQRNSEVARLLTQIDNEYKAARQGLSGLAQGGSLHSFMIARTERIAELHGQLYAIVGDGAMQMICDLDKKEPEDDLELAAIAMQLKEMAEYAIEPRFKKRLCNELSQQYRLEMMR